MKSIIVPVDFSPVSLNAVHYATNMAVALKADIVLLNTYEIPLTFSEVPVAAVSVEELASISEKRLGDLKSSLEHITSNGLKIYRESKLGSLIDELEALCVKLKPMAVVMGTLGHGQVHDLFLGANTVTAMHRISIPIIVVPAGALFRVPEKILLACDLGEVVDTLPSKHIRDLMRWFDSRLYVLNIRREGSILRDAEHSETLMLDTILTDLGPEYHFLQGEDVPESVGEFAENNGMDWIVVVPKKHNKLAEILHRSVSREIAYRSHIPLVSIHA